MRLLRYMEGRSTAEQRAIVKTAEALPLRIAISTGEPTVRASLADPRKRDG